jgi:hypothetical protein
MRINAEAIVRGERMELELSERDFCPECCGTLEIAGVGERSYLRCTSCYLALRPRRDPKPVDAAPPAEG